MKLKIITHYSEEDPEFFSDYFCIEILDSKGKSIYFKYDSYHDKGQEKVEGFIDGIKYSLLKTKEKLIIERENKADGEKYT